MATIHDVARRARVSVMTVSRVLNKPEKVSAKTIKKVKRVMEELGYQPSQVARSLVKRRTNTIGIVMPDIKNTFFNSWFRSVEEYARRFGYTTLLCNTDEDPEDEMKLVRTFLAHRVDGILIVPHSEASVRYLIKAKVNTVLVDRVYSGIDVDFVATDHYEGAVGLTEYLIASGHRKIAVLRGPGMLFPDIERYRGFSDAMKKNNIEVFSRYVHNCEFMEERAFAAVSRLLSDLDPPTVIFSFNSLMTIGAIKATASLGLKIPGDVSLVGYDEIPGSEIFTPGITHVRQPIEELGRNATRILISKIENPKQKVRQNIFLKPELVIRESCAKQK